MVRNTRRMMVVLFAFVLALYWRMGAPGLLLGDSAELQMAAWRLGLAHATGYPLYLLAGWAWQHLLSVVGIDPAHALNLLSALFGALTIAGLYRLLVYWLPGTNITRSLAALLATLFFVFNPTFWSQNLIAEVYTLHTLFIVLILDVAYRVATHHPITLSPCHLVILSFLAGLSLTHHANTLFLLPGIIIVAAARSRRIVDEAKVVEQSKLGGYKPPLRNWRIGMGAILAFLLPFALYFYIPLRSGVDASPWYHVSLGTERLALYQNDWQGFFNFVSGRSISVGFHDVATAISNLSQAWTLWKLHFGWPGLLLVVIGLFSLIQRRAWTILLLTVPLVLLQQLFNLFYAIGDILVYYIPLYLVGAIWLGFGAAAIGRLGEWESEDGRQKTEKSESSTNLARSAELTSKPRPSPPAPRNPLAPILLALLFVLPLQLWRTYQPGLDQSKTDPAQPMWQAILAAQPPDNAMLVSNDRDEMVPLFYLQAVEGQTTGISGLFPLLTPESRFADLGATVATAYQTGRPVFLIKPMPGLEVRYRLQPATPPLVQVLGDAIQQPATIQTNLPFGPLTLIGYDWISQTNGAQIALHWQVNERIAADYTATVQVFNANGDKIGQDDHKAGRDYYPTSLWKVGEQLFDLHPVQWMEPVTPANPAKPAKLLVGMYRGADFTPLVPALEINVR